MATETRSTYGATFKYGSPLVTVGHIMDITPPPETMTTFEVDYHDVEETEMHPGKSKTGPMTLKVGFDANDTAHIGLKTAKDSKTLTAFEIGIPGTSPALDITFTGYVVGFAIDSLPAVPKEQTLTVTIQPMAGTVIS